MGVLECCVNAGSGPLLPREPAREESLGFALYFPSFRYRFSSFSRVSVKVSIVSIGFSRVSIGLSNGFSRVPLGSNVSIGFSEVSIWKHLETLENPIKTMENHSTPYRNPDFFPSQPG